MTRPQINRQAMAASVLLTMKQNKSQWEHIPSIITNVGKLQQYFDKIKEYQFEQVNLSDSISGEAKNKLVLRDSIIANLVMISGAVVCTLQGEAQVKHDLIELATATKTDLIRLSQTDFITKAFIVFNVALPLAPTLLQDFNISSAFLNQVYADIIKFDNGYAKIKTIKADLKTHTRFLKSTISDMMNFLRNTLDKNLSIFNKNPFHQTYLNVRELYNYGNGSTAIIGHVSDADGRKVKDVKLKMVTLSEVREIKINRKGNFHIHNLSTLHTISLITTSKNHLPAEYEVHLKPKVTNRFDITMHYPPMINNNETIQLKCSVQPVPA